MRLNIIGLQSIGVRAILQCRLSHSALMTVSVQTSLLNDMIRSLRQLVLRKIVSCKLGTSKNN